jgi:ABC-type dipeptide/oligopeptide/nickel transport system ATPase component
MRNLYLEKEIKKHMDELPCPTESNTNIKYGDRVIVVGGSGSGKTNWLANFIINAPNTFEQILVCSMAIKEPIYDWMASKLKGKMVIVDKNHLPSLKELHEARENDSDQYLVVFDDCVTALKDDKHFRSKVTEYFIAGRKQHCTMVLLTQSYYAIPKTIRLQATDLCLLQLGNQNDLSCILREFNGIGIKLKQLRGLHQFCTRSCPSKLGLLKIKVNEIDANKRFARNFNEFFNVRRNERIYDETGEEVFEISPGDWFRKPKYGGVVLDRLNPSKGPVYK